MNSTKTCLLAFVAAALALVVVASPSYADPCSASASTLVSRSAGGTCPDALALNQEFTLQYRVTNASIVDDPGGPNDGTQVAAVIPAGKEMVGTLAQETAGVGATALPGTLQFIPVCSGGSAGGALSDGDPCDPSGLPAANCGSGVCGCVSNLPGVTCTLNANPNKITLTVGSDLAFTAGQLRNIATVRVKLTGVVPPPALCGEFYTRLDSTGDVLVTDDALCDNPVTAGAQASANLQAPECTVDSDCGDTECNQCADVGTANHCAPANIGGSCGTDSNPDDCLTPACVDVAGTGVCQQGQNDEPEGTPCQSDGNVCTDDQCDDAGQCQHLDNTVPCDDGLFCTVDDVCASGICTGTPRDCSDGVDCTVDTCNDTTNQCVHTPNNGLCDDADECTSDICTLSGCDYTNICGGIEICRTPGYWGTHSGYEKKSSTNVVQMILDKLGPLEVCGQTISATSNHTAPYLAGLGLSSDIEAVCMKGQGVQQRQLYRQLVAAALNCAMSGGYGDCDSVINKYMDLSFSDCDAVCAGDTTPGLPTAGKCIGRLDCYNNGGTYADGHCGNVANSCHSQPMCNPDIDLCPGDTPASSSRACNEARNNDCTIDSCP